MSARSFMLRIVLLGAFALQAAACSKSGDSGDSVTGGTRSMSPTSEAYGLLDRGETGRAIELLERVLGNDPSNDEARLLLASAFMGKAGIDVLSLHDAFSDVLFSRSLKDVFFTGGRKAEKHEEGGNTLTGSGLPDVKRSVKPTPIERGIQKLDEFLNNLRRVMVVFDRFPRIAESKWPLVDQALWHLDQLPNEREVRVYRMFVRLIYLKEVLITRVVRDQSLGSQQWICNLELENFREHLAWGADGLARVSDDFTRVYPKQASPFDRFQSLFAVASEELDRLESDAPAGGETGTLVVQRRVREALECAP